MKLDCLVFTFASSALTSRLIVEVDVTIRHVTAQVKVVLQSGQETVLALNMQLHETKKARRDIVCTASIIVSKSLTPRSEMLCCPFS